MIHVNGDLSEAVLAYGRIKGFREFCESRNINHRVILTDLGNNYEENHIRIQKLFSELESSYKGMKMVCLCRTIPMQAFFSIL